MAVMFMPNSPHPPKGIICNFRSFMVIHCQLPIIATWRRRSCRRWVFRAEKDTGDKGVPPGPGATNAISARNAARQCVRKGVGGPGGQGKHAPKYRQWAKLVDNSNVFRKNRNAHPEG